MDHNQAKNYLMHYGVPGMKWGHRKQRVLVGRHERRAARYDAKAQKAQSKAAKMRYKDTAEGKAEAKAARKKMVKTVAKNSAKVGAASVATALAAYGTQKVVKNASMKAWSRKGEAIYQKTVEKSLNATSKMVKKGTHYYGYGVQQDIADRAGRGAYRKYMNSKSGETFREAANHLIKMKRNRTRF